MQRCGLDAGAAERGRGGHMHRRMRAATQIRSIKPDAGEHRLRRRHMTALAAVRRTGERQLLIGDAIAVGGAGLDHAQRLQRLDRRARKYRAIDVAQCEHGATISIHDRDRAAVAAFHDGAAHNLDQNRIGHDSP